MTTTLLDWKPVDEVGQKGWVLYLTPHGNSYVLALQKFTEEGKWMLQAGDFMGAKYATQISLPDELIEKLRND